MDDQILAHEYLSRLEFCQNSLEDCKAILAGVTDIRDHYQASLTLRGLSAKSYMSSSQLATTYQELMDSTKELLESYQKDVDLWTKHTADWQRRVDDLLGKNIKTA